MTVPSERSADALTLAIYRTLRTQALRLCRRTDEAEDLVQETLLAGMVAGRHDLPWLSGVLRRQAAMVARTAVRRRRREALAELHQDDVVAEASHPASGPAATHLPWLATLPPSARRLATRAGREF